MLKALSSLRLFFALCAALAAAFVWQTLFNRGVSVYGTPWFAALGLALAVNIAACAFRRGFRAPAHHLLLHAGLVIVIAGSFVTRLRRFEAQLPLRAGLPSSAAAANDAEYRLPFEVTLDSFRLEYYAEPLGKLLLEENGSRRVFDAKPGEVIRTAGGDTVKVLRLVRDFGITAKSEVVEKSAFWLNPAAQVEVTSRGKAKKFWFFANFPGMHGGDLPFALYYSLEQAEIKDFVSAVTVKSADGAVKRAEIGVNRPLRYGGYTLYQTSYDPGDAAYTLLTVTMDRGLWVVYAGFAVLLTGVLLWLRK